MSVTTTCRAPAWRTIAAAMIPIGPAPVINTSSPSTGNASAVWTALPKGSKIAATSRSMPGACFQTFVMGRAMSSANAPVRSTPTPWVCAQRCRRPAMQLRQRPHTRWPSPLTMSPGAKSFTFEPISTTSPTNSWPTIIGTGIVRCAQASHARMWRSVPQMPVRSTRIRTSLIPTSGSGDIDEPDPCTRLRFRERLHAAACTLATRALRP